MHIVFLNPQGNFDAADSYLAEHPDFGGQLVYVKEVAQAMASKKAESETGAQAERQGPLPLIQKAADADEAARKHRFWVIDRDLADAWLRLHDVKGLAN